MTPTEARQILAHPKFGDPVHIHARETLELEAEVKVMRERHIEQRPVEDLHEAELYDELQMWRDLEQEGVPLVQGASA